nr:immunoglobulin heavy chain junction region [Macaca mulatta]MOV88917.1 immunoglobulin heavy chain junction region [Macaca mulatta]MOV90420.1 immunoglobulin heavy chain junction region [Macaca mulatta]
CTRVRSSGWYTDFDYW